MTPGDLARVQPDSTAPRVGNVYLIRGFIGIWSTGIDSIGRKVSESGVRASVYQEDQWTKLGDALIEKYKGQANYEPLVLIGHSYGADDALRIAKRLEEHKIPVDLVITLDPVTPPRAPRNAGLCYNIYQSNMLDSLPFWRGIPLEAEQGAQVVNLNIRTDRRDLLEPHTDHSNIEKNPLIHAEILRVLDDYCPPRSAWAGRRAGASVSSAGRPLIRASADER